MNGAAGASLDEFTTRLEAVQAIVRRVPRNDSRLAVAAILDHEGAPDWVALDGVPEDWVPEKPTDEATFLDRARTPGTARLACVEAAALGVAETGSLVTFGPPTVRRLAMLSDIHILLVREEHVVDNLDDAAVRIFAWRPPPPHLSFVTGASRTSDIERVVAIGVHGPSVVHVVILGP